MCVLVDLKPTFTLTYRGTKRIQNPLNFGSRYLYLLFIGIVRVGLGVPLFIFTKPFLLLKHQKIKFVKSFNNYNNHFK